MDMTSWCAENAVESKLEACLERIRTSRMWWILEGLQKGSCTIKVVHDGDRIDFVPTKTRKTKTEPIVEEPPVELIVPELHIDLSKDVEVVEEVTEEVPIEEVSEESKPTVDVNTKLKPRRSTKK